MSTGRSRYSKIRSKRASELCTSTETLNRLPIGAKSRVCSVVNATRVAKMLAGAILLVMMSAGRLAPEKAP